MYILGFSAYYHDSAACLIENGNIIAAAQEERFTRIKHDSSFPRLAIEYCIQEAGIDPCQIQNIVFYDKPFLKFDRLLETYLAYAPKGLLSFIKSMPLWLKDKLFQKQNISKSFIGMWGNETDWEERLLFSEHHFSHASSAFFPSPFESAAILTMDGVGEWTTTSIALGNKSQLDILKEIHFPHSLGLLYSAITFFSGFKVNSGEYKLMGLAPYGRPVYSEVIKQHLIEIKDDGSYSLNMSYFDYCVGLKMTNDKFSALFGGPPRLPESEITQREMDLAASIQLVTEEVVINLAREAKKITGLNNLCLAGGVALNCVANGRLLREGIFDKIWIQPAAGDAGGAIGAALAAYYVDLRQPRNVHKNSDGMNGGYLGPMYSQDAIEGQLQKCGAIFDVYPIQTLIEKAAAALADQKAMGWMQGRMEFGPRSLGNRSILADPRSPNMQKLLNLKVKFRESFRPFAPSVLREQLEEWFDIQCDSPYMLMVSRVKQEKCVQMTEEQKNLFGIDRLHVARSSIPSVTHVDYSARIQTVHKDTNPIYYELINQFQKLTGCPILINTSFNVRGEPVVCSPQDAFKCFMGTDLDILVIGNCFLEKRAQSVALIKSYKDVYDLD